jgi:Apea-like HEPN
MSAKGQQSDEVSAAGILAIAQKALAGLPPEIRIGHWRYDFAQDLEFRLVEVEPFTAFKNGWRFHGNGGGMTLSGRIGSWALEQLERGESPESIIESAAKTANFPSQIMLDVSPLLGADVRDVIDIDDHTRVIPSKDVPESWLAMGAHRSLEEKKFETHAPCLLVIKYKLTPAFKRRNPEIEIDGSETAESVSPLDRQRQKERVAAAFVLRGSRPVAITASTILAEQDSILGHPRVRHGTLNSAMIFGTAEFEPKEIKKTYEAIVAFDVEKAILLAVGRIRRARSSSVADAALELGIALELLLMHGERNSGEIRNKVALRGAWLLGGDVNERKGIFRSLHVLYDARSKVAHIGLLGATSKFDSEESGALVVQIIVELLRRGKFPDWQSLVLGGLPD